MTIILNLTQHAATADQIAAGVIDLSTQEKAHLVRLLTVDNPPTAQEILDRCADIAQIAALHEPVAIKAMIGGAPAMMNPLEDALLDQGIDPVYAFSVRTSQDKAMPDGTVQKIAVFKHAGWWPATR